MDREELFREYLDKITDLVFDYYTNRNNDMALYSYLLGKGKFKAESFPGAGHNYIEVMNSIYRYCVKHPEVNTAGILEEVLHLCATYFISLNDFLMLMNYIYLQLDNEKNNKAPFGINVVGILNAVKKRIISESKLYQDKMFMEQAHQSEQYLYQKYGHKIF